MMSEENTQNDGGHHHESAKVVVVSICGVILPHRRQQTQKMKISYSCSPTVRKQIKRDNTGSGAMAKISQWQAVLATAGPRKESPPQKDAFLM
mmetsp:Transcript_23867/g.58359  ORF Transcript_23867/g.58359 Transcript_23867/m.58359 type:complete len:93 (+) Transcript_23867:257-535(+)